MRTRLAVYLEPRSYWRGAASTGEYKVPTVIKYNNNLEAFQRGAEVVEYFKGSKNTKKPINDPMIAKCFDRHLGPRTMKTSIRPVPPGISLKTVYADMLAYLFKHACEFIDDADGSSPLWTRFNSNFTLIVAITNDWASQRQEFLRNAVIKAGILPHNREMERLRFVSESEAAIHFAINHTDIGSQLREGMILGICDTDGPDAKTTVYKCTAATPNVQLEEVMTSKWTEAGNTVVDKKALQFLRKKLAGCKFSDDKWIHEMIQIFKKKIVSSDHPAIIFSSFSNG